MSYHLNKTFFLCDYLILISIRNLNCNSLLVSQMGVVLPELPSRVVFVNKKLPPILLLLAQMTNDLFAALSLFLAALRALRLDRVW